MATKRRTDYQVDEEALKRMMAGDVTALAKNGFSGRGIGN